MTKRKAEAVDVSTQKAAKTKIYSQMTSELKARREALVKQKEEYERAQNRLAEIDTEIAVIDEELAEYEAANLVNETE